MIKILVVDDNIIKINNIVKAINECFDSQTISIETVSYLTDAKNIIANNSIDILILDICLPERPGCDLQKDAGINFLNHINGSNRYTYPRFVIALSEYRELADKFSIDEGMIHQAILYDESAKEWKTRLVESIKKEIAIISSNKNVRSYDYDVAVICALSEELEVVKNSLVDVKELLIPNDDYIYYTGNFYKDGKARRVVMAQSTHMGMVPAATLTSKLIFNFAPHYLVMTGIAAGIKGKTNYGDVLAAEYTWDYRAGKDALIEDESVHRNTINQIIINTKIESMVKRLSDDSTLLSSIKKSYIGPKPDNELKIILGPVASGASVVANPQIVKGIQNNQIRDIVGVEMEIFGVYYAARWSVAPKPDFIALKSVCDFADEDKNDDYHSYASYTSAKVFLELAKNYFEYD